MATATASSPADSTARQRKLVLVTGLSGAGRSTALNALEDLGYEAIDNLPLRLLPLVLDHGQEAPRNLAIGLHSRTRDFAAETLLAQLARFRRVPGLAVSLLFVDCDTDVLLRRYKETRRRHPMAEDRPISDGIQREQALLAPFRDEADLVVDTSVLSIHELSRLLSGHYSESTGRPLSVFVTSFGFRNGIPRDADLVFDVRFLKNPHWDPELRPLTGLDSPVIAAVEADEGFPLFYDRLTALLAPLLPRYRQEGKAYLTIAIGCTGGRHRSVMLAERLANWLRAQDLDTGVIHRDLPPQGGAAEIHRQKGTP